MEGKNRLVLALVSSPAPGELEAGALGAACIGAALLSAKLVVRKDLFLIEDSIGDSAETLCARILDKEPDIVGFSLYCWNSTNFIDAARLLRRLRKDLCLIAGGPDAERLIARGSAKADSSSESILKENVRGIFDAVFLGESETSIVEWMGERQSKENHENCDILEERPAAFGTLASPWLGGVLLPAKNSSIAWELSRGCPYHCAYCYEGRGKSGFSSIPEARIRKELDLFVERGVGEIFVLDPTFNADTGRALSLLGLFADVGGNIRWNFEIRAELLTETQAEAFSMLDCSLQIGLQSAIPEVAGRIGRNFDRKKFVNKVNLLNEAGLVFGFDLIYGLPGDTIGGFEASIDFALSLAPNHLDIFRLAVLPGTDLYAGKEEHALVCDEVPPYHLKSHPSFSSEDMKIAEALASSITFFYTKGRAVPWFSAILSPLDMKPSAFFRELLEMSFPMFSADGLGANNSHSAIEKVQCNALSLLYRKRGCEQYLPAALDLVRFHGAWSRAFAEEESSILELSYPAELVGSYEMLDIAAVVKHKRISRRRVQVFPSPQGPKIKRL